MSDLELYEEMVRLVREGEPFALATVVAHAGSSPRKAGAKMLVRGDGSSLGTVGGGRVEQETIEAAHMALAEGDPCTLEFFLTEEYGYACGGTMTIFIEPQGGRPRLIMFGAGHVGRAVTALAHGCGFRVVVVDERPECATEAMLPGADQILCMSVPEASARLQLGLQDSVVIATPGHHSDFAVVRCCLATEAGFIGLLGSRRKRETLVQTLELEGVDETQRARVVSPVGLDIGAQTPQEIAVSIVGQLVAMRRGK
jgi:xanthine dehydrogenase accessory factor